MRADNLSLIPLEGQICDTVAVFIYLSELLFAQLE